MICQSVFSKVMGKLLLSSNFQPLNNINNNGFKVSNKFIRVLVEICLPFTQVILKIICKIRPIYLCENVLNYDKGQHCVLKEESDLGSYFVHYCIHQNQFSFVISLIPVETNSWYQLREMPLQNEKVGWSYL